VQFSCCFTDLTQKLTGSENLVAALTAEVKKFELEVGDLKRKLQASDEKYSQMTQQKQKLVRHFKCPTLLSLLLSLFF
jgi:phage shock protein A